MKFRSYALIACVLGVAVAGCTSDPTSSGSGVPEAIITNRTVTNQTVGTKFSISAYTIDENAQRMAGALTATSAGAAAVIDSVIYLPELLETRIFVNPTGTSTAGTTITVSGHGLSSDVTVVIS